MTLDDVLAVHHALTQAGITVWIDGGWGVDALLGEQTRSHGDLDLAVETHAVPALRTALANLGYHPAPRPDETDWNFVLADAAHRQVDIHAFTFDASGDGVLGDPSLGHRYPAGALTGTGQIGDQSVRCIAAPFVLRFRAAFPPRPVDRLDVAALCRRFGLTPPPAFREPLPDAIPDVPGM